MVDAILAFLCTRAGTVLVQAHIATPLRIVPYTTVVSCPVGFALTDVIVPAEGIWHTFDAVRGIRSHADLTARVTCSGVIVHPAVIPVPEGFTLAPPV